MSNHDTPSPWYVITDMKMCRRLFGKVKEISTIEVEVEAFILPSITNTRDLQGTALKGRALLLQHMAVTDSGRKQASHSAGPPTERPES